MKNKKKYIYIITGILIFLTIIAIIIFVIMNNKNENNNENNNENIDMEIPDQSVEEIPSNNYEGEPQLITIKSTKENSIEKDGVEVTNIEMINSWGDVRVTTTLKNNSNEILNGFFVEIELLDKDGKVISSIAQDSEEKVETNKETTFESSIVELPNAGEIVNARVKSIEKRSTKNLIEDSLNQIEERGNEMMGM